MHEADANGLVAMLLDGEINAARTDAGADVHHPPGASTPADIKAVVEAVAPKPMIILIIRPNISAKELRELDVRRTSIGGSRGTEKERNAPERGFRLSVAPDRKGATMKFVLFRIGGDSIVECPTMDEVWTYVRANSLCSEEITHEDMPPRRILNPEYAIHTFDPDGELVAMSRTRLGYVNTGEW